LVGNLAKAKFRKEVMHMGLLIDYDEIINDFKITVKQIERAMNNNKIRIQYEPKFRAAVK
jgi:hypothetical protein